MVKLNLKQERTSTVLPMLNSTNRVTDDTVQRVMKSDLQAKQRSDRHRRLVLSSE